MGIYEFKKAIRSGAYKKYKYIYRDKAGYLYLSEKIPNWINLFLGINKGNIQIKPDVKIKLKNKQWIHIAFVEEDKR
jgi:hypothetical protein